MAEITFRQQIGEYQQLVPRPTSSAGYCNFTRGSNVVARSQLPELAPSAHRHEWMVGRGDDRMAESRPQLPHRFDATLPHSKNPAFASPQLRITRESTPDRSDER